MQHLQEIIKTTGISRPELADFLGITRQGLGKAERGLFNLSTANLVKLCRLQACLDELPGEDNKKTTAVAADYSKDRKREMECRHVAAILERKAVILEDAVQKKMRLYQALDRMTAEDEADALWIKKTKKRNLWKKDKEGVFRIQGKRKRV